jgi:hypothetical protein
MYLFEGCKLQFSPKLASPMHQTPEQIGSNALGAACQPNSLNLPTIS